MPKPVKVRVLSTGLYRTFQGKVSGALTDTTKGWVYDATLYEMGETDSNGVVVTAQSVEFIDDVGDTAVPHFHPARLEIVHE